jgi:esterase/lipase superfamily enzyme
VLIEYLSEKTEAERIHIIGYSAGTRVVMTAVHQLALTHPEWDKDSLQTELRIGNVLLVGSDYDRWLFAGAVSDGLLNVPSALTLYMSGNDKALGMSRFAYGRSRLGQMRDVESFQTVDRAFMESRKDLAMVDVTDAESSDAGNGHAYFRKSPWVSSDLLMTLMYDLRPEDRGLVRAEKRFYWSFPPDYVSRLRQTLIANDPTLEGALAD